MRRVRDAVLAEVPGEKQRIRYDIAAMLLGGRYPLHFAGWKKHIGLYPVPTLPESPDTEVAPLCSGKESLVQKHADRCPTASSSASPGRSCELRSTSVFSAAE